MYITIEETLKTSDLPADMLPHLLLSEMVLEGPRKDLVWLNVVGENRELIGKDGCTIKIPFQTHLSGHSVDAATFEASPSFTTDGPTITRLPIEVVSLMYSAFKISRILRENNPSIDWLRQTMRNSALALSEFLNVTIRDLYLVAGGVTTHSTSAGLTYSECLDARVKLENLGWINGSDRPYLIVAPETKVVLMKETGFVDPIRYSISELEDMVEGEAGMYAGMKVLVDPYLDGLDECFIVPSVPKFGPIALVVWKRLRDVESKYDAETEETFVKTTERYIVAMVQPESIVRITLTTGTP